MTESHPMMTTAVKQQQANDGNLSDSSKPQQWCTHINIQDAVVF